MATIVINVENDEKNFITHFLKKMGIKYHNLSVEEKEDMGIANAIKKGKTGKHIDTVKFLKSLE